MKDVRSRSVRHVALRLARWVILLFPISLTGCFDSQSAANRAGQGKGISSINRYFLSGQTLSGEKTSENGLAAEFTSYLGFSRGRSLPQDLENLDIALPDFIGSERTAGGSMLRAGSVLSAASTRMQQRNSSFSTTAQLFDKSFNQFVSAVFNKNKSDLGSRLSDVFRLSESLELESRDDLPNPFTEAKQKRELASSGSTGPETGKTEVAEESVSNKDSDQEVKHEAESPKAAAAPQYPGIPSGPADHRFLIIGDLDGSGVLKALRAVRSGDNLFISDDGERSFNLYVNADAVGQERSFYVDDIDSDGADDLLVTSRSFLFGAVLLGDGAGGYRVADKFITGYEPIIPSAGPNRDGKLEILALNARTGVITAYVYSDRYRLVQTQNLSFLPNYLLHLVLPDTSRDFLMAAKIGGMEQILGWGKDNVLRPTSDVLGADAEVLSGSFISSSVQAFQVGSYASLVVGNQGKSFNVANIHMSPRTFLVLGDFYGTDSLDVAVGRLTGFNPKKQ